jgi:phenylacetate-CoA ligase
MHTMDDFMIVEVVKSDPASEFGQVVITQLENWGSPLIRYNLEDLAIPDGEAGACPLGLGFGRIRQVVGKELDLIQFPDGRFVHGQFLVNLMLHVNSVRRFQILQKAPDQLEIALIPVGDRIPPEDEAYLKDAIREYMGPIHIKLKVVTEIPDEPSGKFRAVKSDIKRSED